MTSDKSWSEGEVHVDTMRVRSVRAGGCGAGNVRTSLLFAVASSACVGSEACDAGIARHNLKGTVSQVLEEYLNT